LALPPEDFIPLHSVEAEMSVLGSMLLSKRVAEDIAEVLQVEHFYRPGHRTIYAAMMQLLRRNQALDIVTVRAALEEKDQLADVGGLEYLMQLAEYVPSPANGMYYANIVADRAVLRSLQDAGQRIVAISHENSGMTASEKVDEAEKALFEVGRARLGKEFKHVSELTDRFFADVDRVIETGEPIRGILSGFSELDKITNGFFPGDLVVVGARPAMGKTAFALDLALAAARHLAGNVAIFSLEMTGVQLVKRMVSMISGISASVYGSPESISGAAYTRLVDACEVLTQLPIHIDDSTDLNHLQIRGKARRLAANGGLTLVVVDYLQLMSATRRTDNRTQEVAEVARGLKNMAKDLQVPVVALAQLNRQLEAREDKRPTLADIRESGSIEAEADVVMFLHREEYYKARERKAHDLPPDPDHVEQAEIIVAKHRNGPTGTAVLGFQPAYMRYRNLHLGAEDFD
jgi:replicative DNA helicase